MQGAASTVRLAIVGALATRAEALEGEARRLVLQRIEALRAEAPPDRIADAAPDETPPRQSGLAQLCALVDRLGRSADPRSAPTAPSQPASLHAVSAHKRTWSRLRAEQRLRQALAQVPANSGPLNSSHIVNRMLQAMRDASPEYLDAFMLHVDTLLWLEQASGGRDRGRHDAIGMGPGSRKSIAGP